MTESALTEQPLLESEAQSSTLSDLVSTNGSNSDIEHPDDSNPPQGVLEDSEIDTMLYPYLRHNEEADVEAHVCAFLTMWQANHVSQRLVATDAET